MIKQAVLAAPQQPSQALPQAGVGPQRLNAVLVLQSFTAVVTCCRVRCEGGDDHGTQEATSVARVAQFEDASPNAALGAHRRPAPHHHR